MSVFVVDASVTLAWCFEDEKIPGTERLQQGDRIIVPAHWPTEVANALLMGVRRKRIKPEQPPLITDPAGL
jgi:predicted nucleic acid-binding protein